MKDIFDDGVSPTTLSNNQVLPVLPNLNVAMYNANLASEVQRRLCEYVVEFERSLEEDEEVAFRLVSFGESIIVYVEDIGYYNPSLISFVGFAATGEKVNLIQHISQLSFLLIATKTTNPRRIGFRWYNE